MSTPAVTIIKNKLGDGEAVEVARIYRHWDGDPAGHGADIAAALVAASNTPASTWLSFSGEERSRSVLNNRNWGQHFLRYLLIAKDADLEVVHQGFNGYAEWTYVVTGTYDDFGGKFDITADDYLARVEVAAYYDMDFDKPEFRGDAADFSRWIETQRGY